MTSPTKRHLRGRKLKNTIKRRKLAIKHLFRRSKCCRIRYLKKNPRYWCKSNFNTCKDCCQTLHESPALDVKCMSCISEKIPMKCSNGCCNSYSDLIDTKIGLPNVMTCIQRPIYTIKSCESCGVQCVPYIYDFKYCSSCDKRKMMARNRPFRARRYGYEASLGRAPAVGIPFWTTQQVYIKPARS